MGGLLKPAAARVLVKALKEETGLPIHFHTHDTAGIACATILAASEAGVDAVDCAMDSLSGNTSQATLGTIVEALKHSDRATGLDIAGDPADQQLLGSGARPLRGVRIRTCRRPRPRSTCTRCPAGSSPTSRRRRVPWGWRIAGTRSPRTYADVNRMFGDVIKVTPIAKIVGDMALMMVSQGLTCEDVLDPETEVSFPESVITLMKGQVGQPHGGLPQGHPDQGAEGREADHRAPRLAAGRLPIWRPIARRWPTSWGSRSTTRI